MEQLIVSYIVKGGLISIGAGLVCLFSWHLIKGYLSNYAAKSVEIRFQKEKTQIEESIKNTFAKELEDFKAELDVRKP